MVRRIPDLNAAKHRAAGQDTLFDTWRFHAFFTTPTRPVLDTVAADKTHRGHAIIEQVHADLKNSALAHLPTGVFTANAAWLVLAVIAFNLTRVAGVLTGTDLARATIATLRRRLIHIPARATSRGRRDDRERDAEDSQGDEGGDGERHQRRVTQRPASDLVDGLRDDRQRRRTNSPSRFRVSPLISPTPRMSHRAESLQTTDGLGDASAIPPRLRPSLAASVERRCHGALDVSPRRHQPLRRAAIPATTMAKPASKSPWPRGGLSITPSRAACAWTCSSMACP